MKRVEFSEELGHLIDAEGVNYTGKRVSTSSVYSANHSTYHQAELDAMYKLLETAEQCNADAYEVVDLFRYESRPVYNSTPYAAKVTALLYKNN